MRNQIKSLIFDETSIEESKDAPVASSESLYHLPTLWSESVKENKLNKPPRVEEDVTDTTSDNSSNFSESDGRGSSIMSRKSLAFALVRHNFFIASGHAMCYVEPSDVEI